MVVGEDVTLEVTGDVPGFVLPFDPKKGTTGLEFPQSCEHQARHGLT
jgi:flavoprotein